MAAVIGTTKGSKALVTTFRPSTADSTEMAGVMTPSPYNRPAASTRVNPSPPSSGAPVGRSPGVRDAAIPRWISARSAKVPPCPSWSARRTRTMYLTVTERVRIQSTRLVAPTAFWGV